MIVSWNWLKEYVDLQMPLDEVVDRLTMSGLNLEEVVPQGDDQAIDLEVTSNRPDCLGHLGIAREISVLYDLPMRMPEPELKTSSESIADVCSVEIQSPETCFRYTARLIKGVKIGPSPQWLQDRLTTIGVGVVNNVVDVTNYVMFECGQPLHAFDFAKLKEGKIVVRNAKTEEPFEAIDHKTYTLDPAMCVIADAEDAVALGGVMGGADSEVSDSTTDILIEAAYFDQLAVRNAARKLKLHSPSSFRFERDIDSSMLDWASRRACFLIQELAGGEIVGGSIDVGQPPQARESITLRLSQLKRILGIEIPADFARRTLEKLGLEIQSADSDAIVCVPPSWRKDLSREIDLIEEVGRVYGFDKIPDNVNVPMAASHRPQNDRMLDRIRNVLTAAGFDEAVTPSLVPQPWSDAFSPWSEHAPLMSSQPMQGVLEEYSKNIGAVNLLRRSLVPSLVEVRRINEYRSNADASLFETATVYLTQEEGQLPDQPSKLGCVTGDDYYRLKGVIEMVVAAINPDLKMQVDACEHDLLDATKSAELKIEGVTLGWIGEVSTSGKKKFGLRTPAAVAEIDLDLLQHHMVAIAQHRQLSAFPAITRDFNFIVDNRITWSELESNVRSAGGELLEAVSYRETFRDEEKDGTGKKRVLLSVTLRSNSATLTGEEADQQCGRIIDQCKSKLDAVLLG